MSNVTMPTAPLAAPRPPARPPLPPLPPLPQKPEGPVILGATTYDRAGNAMTQTNAGPRAVSPALPGPAVVDPEFMRTLQELVKAGKSITPAAASPFGRAPSSSASRMMPRPPMDSMARVGSAPEPMIPLYAELIGNGYGPATTRRMGMNSVQVGSIPASQAAAYGGPDRAQQIGSFVDPSTQVANDEHDKWKAANPGDGPYSGSG